MTKTQQLVLRVLQELGRAAYTTQLVKLIYFVDYIHCAHRKRTYTGLRYEWAQYGPNAVSNQIVREAEGLAKKGDVVLEPMETIYGGIGCLYRPAKGVPSPTFDALTETIIKDVISKHRRRSATQIANASKRTLPFAKAQPGDLLNLNQPNPFAECVGVKERVQAAELAAAGQGKSLQEIKSKYRLV
jgi:hypothetical protein